MHFPCPKRSSTRVTQVKATPLVAYKVESPHGNSLRLVTYAFAQAVICWEKLASAGKPTPAHLHIQSHFVTVAACSSDPDKTAEHCTADIVDCKIRMWMNATHAECICPGLSTCEITWSAQYMLKLISKSYN